MTDAYALTVMRSQRTGPLRVTTTTAQYDSLDSASAEAERAHHTEWDYLDTTNGYRIGHGTKKGTYPIRVVVHPASASRSEVLRVWEHANAPAIYGAALNLIDRIQQAQERTA